LGLKRVPEEITQYVEANKRAYPSSARSEIELNRWRRQARQGAALMVWYYTISWPILWLVHKVAEIDKRAVDARDPYLRDQIVKDQQERIAELERELGIPREKVRDERRG
jgi:hypothetical protein